MSRYKTVRRWRVGLLGLFGVLLVLGYAHGQGRRAEHRGPAVQARPLEMVAQFKGMQVTGVTASESGRIFANFPRWRDGVPFSVVEVSANGSFRPYPDKSWNQWEGQPAANRFTCVQSVVAHGNALYVLDPSSPKMAGVVGNARLFVFDLDSNQVRRTYVFDSTVAPKKSYLNDLRVDDAAGKIYITDSGLGAIVVLDTATGRARRLLADHPSTKAENIVLKIDGKEFLRNGKPPRIHSDGIELDTQKGYLYYHALTGYHLYRVPTKALLAAFGDPSKDAALAASVQNLGKTPAPDGMIFDRQGNLYLGDLERDAVVYRTASGRLQTLVRDPRIRWADTFAIDRNNRLIFTVSRIHQVPPSGVIDDMEFPIYSVPLPR